MTLDELSEKLGGMTSSEQRYNWSVLIYNPIHGGFVVYWDSPNEVHSRESATTYSARDVWRERDEIRYFDGMEECQFFLLRRTEP